MGEMRQPSHVSTLPAFRSNDAPTLGTELELMLVDPGSLDLTASAVRVQRCAADEGLDERVKLEITQAMIEVNSSVHTAHGKLHAELQDIGSRLQRAAEHCGIAVSGGGTHPYHRWQERALSPMQRFQDVGHTYGYLAKQFTVFGQHVHVGCRDGDDAVRIADRLALYVPQFIAIGAASPFHRGIDTSFDSCRLNMIAAFPLAGRMPSVDSWREFEEFFDRLERLGIVSSIKDFYWDVRPKPEFGTVEVRVPDTPLDVRGAADIAAYVQALVEWSRRLRPTPWLDEYTYRHNRFQAARFGYEGRIIVGPHGERTSVRDHIAFTLDQVAAVGSELASDDALQRIGRRASERVNDAAWLRAQYAAAPSLESVMRRSVARWRGALAEPAV